MILKNQHIPILLMILHEPTLDHLLTLLKDNNYYPIVIPDPTALPQALKAQPFAVVFIDCEAVISYGGGIYAKIKVSCPRARIILFGQRAHLQNKSHRDLVKEAMDLGVYACLLAPYKDWEVLSMVKHILLKENTGLPRVSEEEQDS
jgi:DNA-binding NtrC family response regulator